MIPITILYLALRVVPVLFFMTYFTMSCSELCKLIPMIFQRQHADVTLPSIVIKREVPVPWYHRWENFDGERFCRNGQLTINDSFGAAYLPVGDPYERMDKQNSSFIVSIARVVHTLILDCPQMGFMSWDPKYVLNLHLRTFELFSWTLYFNKQHKDKRLNVWLRLPEHHNNSFNFDSYFCANLALEGNRRSSNSVQGFVMNSAPAVAADGPSFSRVTSFWKDFVGKFGFNLGLVVSGDNCSVPDFSRRANLDKFDELFFHEEDRGSITYSTKTGITRVAKSKFKLCQKVVMPTRMKIVIGKMILNPILWNPGPLCIWHVDKW